MSTKRSHRLEKLARIYDAEILPVWSQRFGQMLLRGLRFPDRCQILDVACGTGYPAVEILRRIGPDGRLIAIDPSSAMLDVARRKIEETGLKGVFFRTESMEPRLSFADDVYDLVVCNLGLTQVDDRQKAVAEFARVTKPRGRVRCTLPVEGTFQEFYDIFREVLTKHDKHDTLARLGNHLAESYPSVAECEAWMKAAGLVDNEVDVDEFTMLFRSSREFFFAPVIEYGPLAAWKRLAGRGQEMQDVFWYIKEAIDAYFEGRAFEVTVKAACLSGRKPAVEEDETGQVLLIEDIEELIPLTPVSAARTAAIPADDDADETLDGAAPVVDDGDMPEHEVEDADIAEVEEIDAFSEGAQRPDHLDVTDGPLHDD